MEEADILNRMVSLIAAYRERSVHPDEPVVHYRPPDELRELVDLSLPEGHGSAERMMRFLEQYLGFSVRTAHPQYANQLWAGFTIPGLLGDAFASLTNTSMYTYEVAPVATLMEREIVARLSRLAGHEGAEGLFLTGGSNANLVAMLAARNRFDPAIKDRGLVAASDRGLAAFVSEQAHYSFLKAANVLGIGMRHLVSVRADERGRMIPAELDSAMRSAVAEGKRPFFVGATSGTTVLAAFDPLVEIGEIARRHGAWFHVDASLGGSFLVSRKHRHLLRGIETADSFGWDLHKLMGVPLMASLLFMREKGHLHDCCASEQTDYLFHDDEDASWDLGPMSLQCGRKVDVLKVWLSWQYFGHDGYEERMDRLMELARHAEEVVAREPRLALAAPRESIAVCFRVKPAAGEDSDGLQKETRQRLHREGRSLVNYSTLRDGRVAIRYVLANPEITEADVDRFFANVLAAADDVRRSV
jgi:glutamate/tyrosine decarboxylase-like PLP-dependent enzyme